MGSLVDWAGGNWVDFQVPSIATKRWPLASIRNADPSRAIQSAGAVCVTTNKPRFGSTATSKMGITSLESTLRQRDPSFTIDNFRNPAGACELSARRAQRPRVIIFIVNQSSSRTT